MRHSQRSLHWSLLAAIGVALSGCTVAVVEAEPKGGCLYHCEDKACCEAKVTESWCRAKYGTWSSTLDDCPD